MTEVPLGKFKHGISTVGNQPIQSIVYNFQMLLNNIAKAIRITALCHIQHFSMLGM